MNFKIYLALAILGLGVVLFFIYRNKIKAKLLEKYEREAIKIPNLTWSKKNGESFTEDVVIKRSRLFWIGDWGRIYPLVDETGKWNWVNAIFGGYKNFIKTIIVLVIISLFFLGYYEVFSSFEAYKEACVLIK